MKRLEKSGRTVEEAIEAALSELDVSRDEVKIEVIEEGSRGFLGIGRRPSQVEVTKLEQENPRAEKAEKFLRDILDAMGFSDCTVEAKLEGRRLQLDVSGKDVGVLIGKRGQTLNDLQYLISLGTNHGPGEYLRINLDIEGYRQKRAESLVQLAENTAQRVTQEGRRRVLEPMNPYDRRIIHTALQDNNQVVTRSEGREPYRRVVVAPKSED